MKPLTHPLLIALLLAASSGCVVPGPAPVECVVSEDCPLESRCVSGICSEPEASDESAEPEAPRSDDVLVECSPGYSPCDGACTFTDADPLNCGGCGVACAVDESCFEGRCQIDCPGTICDDVCVDTETDPENCGGCGMGCGVNGICIDGACCERRGRAGGVFSGPFEPSDCDGQCVHVALDPNNCGGCGVRCTGDDVCFLGTCVTPPEPEVCVPTLEVCDGVDNDCDGVADPEGCDPRLLAWYRFDEDRSLGYVHDTAGNYDGEIGGLRGVPGRIGRAVRLTGGSHIKVPFDHSFGNQITVEAWVRHRGCGREQTIVFRERNFRLSVDHDCDAEGAIDFDTSGWFTNWPDHDVAADRWVHVAMTYGGDGNRWIMWVDGVPTTDFLVRTADLDRFGDDDFYIGARPTWVSTFGGAVSTWADPFNGEIDEVKIWRVARSAEELCASAGRRIVDGFCR